MEGVTPYVLRHSFAKAALDSGTDLVAVATLLGHQRLDIVCREGPRRGSDSGPSGPLQDQASELLSILVAEV